MLILLASRNPGKLAELKHLFSDTAFELKLPDEAGMAMPLVREDGSSFAENALIKARALAEISGQCALADDSGLEVDALDGAPGIHSARFAGPGSGDRDNLRKLLASLGDNPVRSARFRCVLALARPSGESLLAEGVLEGEITREPQGTSGFGYDPVFLLPDRGKTLAEIGFDEKQSLSHRTQAAARMKNLLREL